MTPSQLTSILNKFLSDLQLSTNYSWPTNFSNDLLKFMKHLLKWNKKIRLTGAKNLQELLERHILDSLHGLTILEDIKENEIIMDIGSGGGFPAFPLALARPDLHWHLIESHKRRTAFLQQTQLLLQLPNLKLHPVRMEGDPAKENLPTNCQCLLFRAVAPDSLLPHLHLYMKNQSKIIYWATSSFKATHTPSLEHLKNIPYTLPQGEKFQLCVFAKKIT